MPLRLHNTLTGRDETFIPLSAMPAAPGGQSPPEVTFYTCGPTVYDFAHIGNFRSFLAADVLRRWLESPLCARVDASGEEVGTPVPGRGGYRVTQVMNITDVGHLVDDAAIDSAGEDRMESAARRLLEDKKSGKLPAGMKEAGEIDPTDPYAIADFYARAFVEDALKLGVRVVEEAQKDPTLQPRPTRKVRQMLAMILALIDKRNAYVAPDGVVYFDTQSFPDYGKLSGNTLEKIRSGAGGRVRESTQSVKRHPADFMLWKPDPRHTMRWDPLKVLADDPALCARAKELGLREGYPGWHIECSAMARERLGDEIDLHSGGEDNIFPHHECEIAQSRCATGKPFFARHWLHARFLMVEGEKMSKSKGNFFTLRDLLAKGFSPAAIRFELIKTHYRSNANFTEQGLKDAERNIERWRRFVGGVELPGGTGVSPVAQFDQTALSDAGRAAWSAFTDSMNDDLNVAGAIAAANTLIARAPTTTGAADKPADAALLRLFDGVLGVLDREAALGAQPSGGRSEVDARIDELVKARTEARATKNWPEADRIRKELDALGVIVTDSPTGPTWTRKVKL